MRRCFLGKWICLLTDTDYADDIAILANTPNQAEILLHSLARAAAGIGLYVNAHKTEYMCYDQTGDISTLDGTPLKLVDKFTYIGSSVASTEKDIDTRLKSFNPVQRREIFVCKQISSDSFKNKITKELLTYNSYVQQFNCVQTNKPWLVLKGYLHAMRLQIL